MTIHVELITATEPFEALSPAWWRLWRRCPDATPFQSPAWLVAWWRAFQPGELAVFAAWRGRELVGLAPFYREDAGGRRRLLPIGISLSDYLDIVLDPACAPAAGELIVQHASELAWDEWEWTELAPGARALAVPCPAACLERDSTASLCPTLVLPEKTHDLRNVVPPTQHRKLRMARHRAARRGNVQIVDASPDPAGFLVVLEALHRSAWAARGEAGVMADPRVTAFQQHALPALTAAGLARTYVLRIDNAPAAAYYGLFDRGRAYGYLTGFDPNFAFESPGTLILAHAIEQALGGGAREFHFLRGQEGYKYAWGAQDRPNRRRVFTRVNAHADAV